MRRQLKSSYCINDENENNTAVKNKDSTTILDSDDIPLIDSQEEPDQDDLKMSVEMTKPRPNMFLGTANVISMKNLLESPDIFHLRAPLVSCENILTPTVSTEMFLKN